MNYYSEELTCIFSLPGISKGDELFFIIAALLLYLNEVYVQKGTY